MVNLIKVSKGKSGNIDLSKRSSFDLRENDGIDLSKPPELNYRPVEKPPEQKKVSQPFIPFIPYEKVPEYLVPKGDGWYGDPQEPPDPQDCDSAMGSISPFCGGNPINVGGISKLLPFTYEPKIRFDECNIWAQLGGSLFGVQMPPKTIAFRAPGECRNEPPPEPPPPPPLPGEATFDNPFKDIDPNTEVIAFVGFAQYRPSTGATSQKWVDYYCPGIPYKRYPSDSHLTQPIVSAKTLLVKEQTSTVLVHYDSGGTLYRWGLNSYGIVNYVDNQNGTRTVYNPGITVVGEIEEYIHFHSSIYRGRWGLIQAYIERGVAQGSEPGTSIAFTVNYLIKSDCSSPRDKRKLPPPPREDDEDDECCMSCQQQNELLRQLLAEIKKANKAIGSDSFPVQARVFDQDETKQEAQTTTIRLNSIAQSITRIIEEEGRLSKIIGIDTFPLELPESVIVHPERNVLQKALNFLNPFKNVKINSVMELLVWNIKQQSAVFGQWGQVIQVESTEVKEKNVDGKITKEEHTKTEEVVLPNMSQTMKEQILLQTQSIKNNGLMLDCVVKLMIELAQTKLITAEIVKRVEDIQQYMDYPTNERTVEVPLQINFPNVNDPQDKQNDLFELLKEGKAKIVFDDWTGSHSQDEKFLDLLQAAKVIQGVYFNKTD